MSTNLKALRDEVAEFLSKLDSHLSQDETPKVSGFDPTFLKFLQTGSPYVFSSHGSLSQEQAALYRPYVFVNIEYVTPTLVHAIKMSNGKKLGTIVVHPSVDTHEVKLGPAVLLDDGSCIRGIYNLPGDVASDRSRVLSACFRKFKETT